MAFTVYGPGIRDEIYLDNLFAHPVVAAAAPSQRVLPIKDDEVAPTKSRFFRSAGQGDDQSHHLPVKVAMPIVVHAWQIMSAPVIALRTDASLDNAWRTVRDKGFRHIPVTENDKIIGMISDRDLLRAQAKTSGTITLNDVMHTPVVCASADESVRSIALAMYHYTIGAMPVVEFDGRPIGIVTRSDVLRAVISIQDFGLWL